MALSMSKAEAMAWECTHTIHIGQNRVGDRDRSDGTLQKGSTDT